MPSNGHRWCICSLSRCSTTTDKAEPLHSQSLHSHVNAYSWIMSRVIFNVCLGGCVALSLIDFYYIKNEELWCTLPNCLLLTLILFHSGATFWIELGTNQTETFSCWFNHLVHRIYLFFFSISFQFQVWQILHAHIHTQTHWIHHNTRMMIS